jgi:two-component system chemotaxis response regulator CheY
MCHRLREAVGNAAPVSLGKGSKDMKILIAEDDFASRLVLQKLISPYGEVHVAANGVEALDAFKAAGEQGEPYGLICLDIMMPEMDGQAVLREIRTIEKEGGLAAGNGVKVIMTTALKDRESVMTAFREQCDGYLVKPIDRQKLVGHLRDLGIAA